MALSSTPTLLEINAELGTINQSLNTCIANAGKTGIWNSQLDFAGYIADSISASPNLFDVSNAAQSVSVTITSSSNWEVYSQSIWVISVVPNTGTTGVSVSVSINIDKNLTGTIRTGYVYFRLQSNTSITVAVQINQAA